MDPLYPRPEDANFKSEKEQRKFTEKTDSDLDLLRKELSVNTNEQILLSQRIMVLQESMNGVPSYDPRYTAMTTQLQMDKIELDELKIRQNQIQQKIEELQ